jgi:hypothetical protein
LQTRSIKIRRNDLELITSYSKSTIDKMKIYEGSMITNLRERIQESQSQSWGNPNNRVKCLAINQVLRAKIYNSCLQKCVFIFTWYYFLSMSSILFPISLHIYLLSKPTTGKLSCSGCCLHKSGALISFLPFSPLLGEN